MSSATVRFHGELNDFLTRLRRGATLSYTFGGRVSIKDVVESLGVPHPEIEALFASGSPVDFGYIIRDQEAIEAYPRNLPTGINYCSLRPALPTPYRFVLDTHLGTLASHLRMLGFDTLYRNDYDDDELACIADVEMRILLTRDIGLLKRGRVVFGYFVRETNPQRQVIELAERYELRPFIQSLQRCTRCNGLLQPVSKADIAERLAPKTRDYYTEFSLCESCGQIYWKGSHYERMQQFINTVLKPE